MKYLLLVSLLLVGCDDFTTSSTKEANSLSYFKDERTGLCFAVSTVIGNTAISYNIYNNVPCNDAVEKLIPAVTKK